MDSGKFLCRSCPGHTTVWVGDVGGDPLIKRLLGGFHYKVVWWISGNIPWWGIEGTC